MEARWNQWTRVGIALRTLSKVKTILSKPREMWRLSRGVQVQSRNRHNSLLGRAVSHFSVHLDTEESVGIDPTNRNEFLVDCNGVRP